MILQTGYNNKCSNSAWKAWCMHWTLYLARGVFEVLSWGWYWNSFRLNTPVFKVFFLQSQNKNLTLSLMKFPIQCKFNTVQEGSSSTHRPIFPTHLPYVDSTHACSCVLFLLCAWRIFLLQRFSKKISLRSSHLNSTSISFYVPVMLSTKGSGGLSDCFIIHLLPICVISKQYDCNFSWCFRSPERGPRQRPSIKVGNDKKLKSNQMMFHLF